MYIIRNCFLLIAISYNFVNCELLDSGKPIVVNYDFDISTSDSNIINDPIWAEFKIIKDNFFKALSNTSAMIEINNFEEVLQLFDTDYGREIGNLFIQGLVVGYQHNNPDQIFEQFWSEFKGKLSPELEEKIKEYSDLFQGMDLFSLYSTLTKLFAKDSSGNSLANQPIGQLINLIQPIASMYGIDMRSLINGIIEDGSSFPDLVIRLTNNFDLSSIITFVSNTFIDKKQTPSTKTKNENLPKGPIEIGAWKLLKPYFKTMLRENNIDLDIDAIFEVLGPLFSSGTHLLEQALPSLLPLLPMIAEASTTSDIINLLSSFFMLNQDKLVEQKAFAEHSELISNELHPELSEKDEYRRANKLKTKSSGLGGIASLLGGLANGNGNQMDLISMLGIASQFMNFDSTGKDIPKDLKNRKNEPTENSIELLDLAAMAVKLVSNGESTSNVLVNAASMLLSKKITKSKKEIPKSVPIKNKETNKETKSKTYLVDILETVLIRIQNHKKCHAKIKSLVTFGKSVSSAKSVGLGDLNELLSPFLSEHVSKNTKLITALLSSKSKSEWLEFASNMDDEKIRQEFIDDGAKFLVDLLKLLSEKSVRRQIYMMALPQIEEVLTSWGMNGLTLENFPARIGPMVGLMSKGWDLPFKPVSLLVPLKNQLIQLKDWGSARFSAIEIMSNYEISELTKDFMNEVGLGLNDFTTSLNYPKIDLSCLPRALCELQFTSKSKIRLYTSRFFGLIYSGYDAFNNGDIIETLKVAQSTLSEDTCKEKFPKKCKSRRDHIHTDL